MKTTSAQRAEFNPDPAAKPYSVTLWGSNPDTTDNDDCWTGDEFVTSEEAITCYRSIRMWPTDGQLPKVCGYDWEYVMIDGPDLHEVTANSDQRTQRGHRRDRAASDRMWASEVSHQAGMAFGCDGYNDAMGW